MRVEPIAVSEPDISEAEPKPALQLLRLPVEKPQAAAAFLRAHSGGVMDLIAHFWERLAHTPPLQRRDLHLLAAVPENHIVKDKNISPDNEQHFSGVMLFVPKAHRADVLALNQQTVAVIR